LPKFSTLKDLNPDLLKTLNRFGFEDMTPIQEESLPITLQNKDLIAQANTGSGKTIAFSLVLLNKLIVKNFTIQSIVLAPTRELANQIASELKQLAKFAHNIKITTLCGGMPYKPQVHSLSHKAHIVIGTPGRILKHLEENSFDPKDINTLVLDEADRMLDMGFYEDINKVIDFLPKQRQTLLFSATYPPNIENLSKNILQSPTQIKIENQQNNKIDQIFFQSELHNKKEHIIKILDHYNPKSTIIFCNMKIDCDNLADELENENIYPLVLHSDLEQKDRDETITLFSNKSYKILIATDVASRGLDIDDVELVINYALPRDLEVYTHRIGRTARAGKSGHAIALVESRDMEIFDDLNYENSFVLENLSLNSDTTYNDTPLYKTLFINGGKKQKLRAGDILGSLTAGIGLDKNDIGKINIKQFCSYVAIKSAVVKKAQKGLNNNKIKGKYFKVYSV
jgi:ATP-independent RNA helicase DbpA